MSRRNSFPAACGISLFLQRGLFLRLRVSLVRYLNAAPLGWYFLHGPERQRFEVFPDTPAMCAERLARGEVDVGLIPSIEYQRIPDLVILPEIAISAADEVRSVLLVRRRDAGSIERVALDTSSRTSVVLAKLLLRSSMGLRPAFSPQEPEVSKMLETCDTALVIGDAALRCDPAEYRLIDLAAEWRRWQGVPFVFAFWACREASAASAAIGDAFLEAKEWGLARIEEIARRFSESLDLPAPFLERYLRQNLDHHLGAEHREGLARFYRLAFEGGFIDRQAPLRFAARTPASGTRQAGR
jgi:chorismate dehydratase